MNGVKGENRYPEYLLKDHLGNTRARIADKNNDNLVLIDPDNPNKDELMNIRHYYPFGMEWELPSYDLNGEMIDISGVENRYTYNGKEFVDDLGINLSEYGARCYDAAIARWTSIDPLAEKFDSWSPYNYVIGNPLILSDPNGMDTLNMHRGTLNTDLSDKYTNVWNVSFSITSNGVTSPLELGDGSSTVYMFGSKEADSKGKNILPDDSYSIDYYETAPERGWDNVIKLADYGKGVLLHPGNSSGDFDGCKSLCRTFRKGGPDKWNKDRFFGEKTQSTLNLVRDLYDKHEANLTGSKFLLLNKSSAPSRNSNITVPNSPRSNLHRSLMKWFN